MDNYFTFRELIDMPIKLKIIDEFEGYPEEVVICENSGIVLDQIPEEVVTCENSGIVLDQIDECKNLNINPVLFRFRFTFKGEDMEFSNPETPNNNKKDQKLAMEKIISIIRPYIYRDVWVASIEHYKKGMEDCTPHIHMSYLSNYKKDTIDKQFKRRFLKEFEFPCTGNRMFSNSPSAENNYKLWRYVMKQQKGVTKRRLIWGDGFEEFAHQHFGRTPMQMRDDAYAVWLTACEVTNAKGVKEEQKKELQDRLFVYLDKMDNKDDLSLKVGIQKFYILEEKKPFNKTTALGYFYNYKIMNNLMTHEDLAKIW